MSDEHQKQMQNENNVARLKTPQEKRIVGIDNKPLPTEDEVAAQREALKEQEVAKQHTIGALRELADKIERGDVNAPMTTLVIPMFPGNVQVLNLGKQIPQPMLGFLMFQMASRMALQG